MSSGKKLHINVAAYHEAGHALAALREGRQVSLVFAFHKYPGNGMCLYAPKPINPHDLAFNPGTAKAAWKHTLEATCAEIRIALAGPLAEAKVLGKPLRSLGARSDLDKCIYEVKRLKMLRSYIARYTDLDPVGASNILSREKRKVRQWIAHPKVWKVIVQLAQKLSAQGILNGKHIDKIIGSVTSPAQQATLDFSSKPIKKPPQKTTNPPKPSTPPWVNNQHGIPQYWSFFVNNSKKERFVGTRPMRNDVLKGLTWFNRLYNPVKR